MARGHVVACNGDTIGTAHVNLIIEAKVYHVKILGSEMEELTSNTIAE